MSYIKNYIKIHYFIKNGFPYQFQIQTHFKTDFLNNILYEL